LLRRKLFVVASEAPSQHLQILTRSYKELMCRNKQTHKQCSALLEYNSRVTKLKNLEGSRNSPLLFLASTHPHPVEKLKHLEHSRMAFLRREKERQRARPASSWKPITQKPPHMSDEEGGGGKKIAARIKAKHTDELTDWLTARRRAGGRSCYCCCCWQRRQAFEPVRVVIVAEKTRLLFPSQAPDPVTTTTKPTS
jgi:uncharacterized caspase-like protein